VEGLVARDESDHDHGQAPLEQMRHFDRSVSLETLQNNFLAKSASWRGAEGFKFE